MLYDLPGPSRRKETFNGGRMKSLQMKDDDNRNGDSYNTSQTRVSSLFSTFKSSALFFLREPEAATATR
ncbi:Protein of unknown function [Gryllus bimaculatus]|nr:Protein of unknown function [Gryllus bimaculatus]